MFLRREYVDKNEERQIMCGKGTWGIAVIFATIAWPSLMSAQPVHPLSMNYEQGVHIFSYDNLTHKSSEHYENLCRVVIREFGLTLDTICVNLVFVDEALQEHLNENNPERFRSTSWLGVYISPVLILMLGEEESDDTFLHEYMHALHTAGLLFGNVPESEVHSLIHLNEGLLLGSRSYLEYLKTAKRTTAAR